jgi:hypothetical protein
MFGHCASVIGLALVDGSLFIRRLWPTFHTLPRIACTRAPTCDRALSWPTTPR